MSNLDKAARNRQPYPPPPKHSLIELTNKKLKAMIIEDLEKLERDVANVFADDEAQSLQRKIPHRVHSLGSQLANSFLLPVYRNVWDHLSSSETLEMRKLECKWEIGHYLEEIKNQEEDVA